MKRKTFTAFTFLLVAISLTTTSCNKVTEALASKIPNLTYEDNKAVITVPASSSLVQQTAFGTVVFDLNQYIKDNVSGTGMDFSYVKHVYVKSIKASVVNGDANNNLSNLTFTTASNPVLVFNTTADPATATAIGGNVTAPPADLYNVSLQVTNNSDILSHMNGKNWAYGIAFKLAKATTKDLQLKLDVQYDLAFN